MDALFVHGINVRGEEAERTRQTIEGHLRRRLGEEWSVAASVWGDDLGARLGLGGKTIPTYETAKGPGSELSAERLQLLWAELYEDPLGEIEVLSHAGPSDAFRGPAEAEAAGAYAEQVRALAEDSALIRHLEPYGWSPYLREAVRHVADSQVLADLAANAEDLTGCTKPVARALFASLHGLATDDGWPPLSGSIRDTLVEHVERALGEPKGVVSWYANRYLQRNRSGLMDRVVPIIGDVIVYQGRGDAIRERVARALASFEGPVCVIAHSLGGIAVVDTLLLHAELRRKVSHLFTMGSQSGFFHEVGALSGMGSEEELPRDFPEWHSFYDHADVLSFLAAPAFPGRVRDIRIQSGEPFPQAHSAYWNSPEVWKVVEAVLTR